MVNGIQQVSWRAFDPNASRVSVASGVSFASGQMEPSSQEKMTSSERSNPVTSSKTMPRWKRRLIRTAKTAGFLGWSAIMFVSGGVVGTIAYLGNRYQLKPTELGFRENQEKIFLGALGHAYNALQGDTAGMRRIENAMIFHTEKSKGFTPHWTTREAKLIRPLSLPMPGPHRTDTLEAYYKPPQKGYPTLVIVHGQGAALELSQQIVRDGKLLKRALWSADIQRPGLATAPASKSQNR
ncbi:MAG: hypothetical protein U0003_00625 [Vampirovibrionales bacterium]